MHAFHTVEQSLSKNFWQILAGDWQDISKVKLLKINTNATLLLRFIRKFPFENRYAGIMYPLYFNVKTLYLFTKVMFMVSISPFSLKKVWWNKNENTLYSLEGMISLTYTIKQNIQYPIYSFTLSYVLRKANVIRRSLY